MRLEQHIARRGRHLWLCSGIAAERGEIFCGGGGDQILPTKGRCPRCGGHLIHRPATAIVVIVALIGRNRPGAGESMSSEERGAVVARQGTTLLSLGRLHLQRQLVMRILDVGL